MRIPVGASLVLAFPIGNPEACLVLQDAGLIKEA